MVTAKSTKSTKKSRAKVKDLPRAEKKLGSKDMKKVKGGASEQALKAGTVDRSLKIENTMKQLED